MSAQHEAVSALLCLPASTLVELGGALSGGILRHGFSPGTLFPLVGDQSKRIDQVLRTAMLGGLSQSAIALLCLGMGRALAERDASERSVQLILSGPEVAGTPVVDTRTTVLSLFEEATEEVVISSYVFYEAAEFFARLAEKHDASPQFRVTFLVDISHRHDARKRPASLVARGFSLDFRKKHWPGKRFPEVWYDPRRFNAGAGEASGVLHAKTVIIDHKVAFITSANFTGVAQTTNIEAGILIRQPRIAVRLSSYFSGLISSGLLQRL